jgi:hypothetical protein
MENTRMRTVRQCSLRKKMVRDNDFLKWTRIPRMDEPEWARKKYRQK